MEKNTEKIKKFLKPTILPKAGRLNPLVGINAQIQSYASTDAEVRVIHTSDLKDKGDNVHFDSEGQRSIGKRFANEFIKTQK